MSDFTRTPNLGLYKPTYDADEEQWGQHLNLNADTLDSVVHGIQSGGPFLPLSGGTMGGPLNVIPTGGTATRSVQDLTGDILNVRDFGAVGNGIANDTAAIQAAVNHGGTIRFPTGRYLITAAIVTPTSGPITVVGDGMNASIIIQATAGADGWVHTSSQYLQMFGMSLWCNGVGGCAVRCNFLGASVSFLTLRDVLIVGNGNQTTNFWHDGIIANNPSNMTIDHCSITGTNNGPLSAIGNAVYITCPLTPAADTGAYVIALYNTTIGYYQNGIVLDSTGHTYNLQGIILDWVNCNNCMQFVRVLGTCLELVLNKCQYEGFGSMIHADGADTVVIRDCLVFINISATMAIAAQLPQDIIYANGGGNWWVKDNRFIVQPSTTVAWVFNLLGNFNNGAFRDNYIWTYNATATGCFNLPAATSGGTNNVIESGTAFSFWNAAWPKWVNWNAAAGNTCSFGALAALSVAPSSLHWQNQGPVIGWNYAGALGETDFVNSRGGGTGGFRFYDVASSAGATPTLLAQITATGINATPVGATTASTGAFTTLSSSGAVSGAGFTSLLAPYAPLASPTFTGTTTVAGLTATGTVSGAGFTSLLAPYALLASPTFTGTTTVAGLTATGTVSGAGFTNLFAAPPAIGGTTPAAGTFTGITTTSPTTGFLTIAANLATVLPPNALSASIGWNYLNGAGEVDYWCDYAASTLAHTFWQRTAGSGTRLMDIGTTGAVTAYGGFVVSAAAGPTIRAGTGAATGTQPKGSIWLRTDGAAGSTLYVTQGGGTWAAVAGV